MTGNAHKEFCHKLLSSTLVREQGLYIIKTNCSGKIVVGFTIKEEIYSMESLFCRFPIDICGIKFLGCAIGFVYGIATKAAIALSIFSFTNCYG